MMTEEQRNRAIKEYRKIKRRNIKARITELKKENAELFRLWAYDKALDEAHLKKTARENLIEIEKLEPMYDRVNTEPIEDSEIEKYSARVAWEG